MTLPHHKYKLTRAEIEKLVHIYKRLDKLIKSNAKRRGMEMSYDTIRSDETLNQLFRAQGALNVDGCIDEYYDESDKEKKGDEK